MTQASNASQIKAVSWAARRVTLLLRQYKFLRFLAVGVLNTIFGYAVFYLALAATGHSISALAVSTVIGAAFNFLLIGSIVFHTSGGRYILRFIVAYALVFITNACTLKALEGALPTAPLQALLLPGLAVLAYLLNRDFVYLDRKKSRGAP